MDVLLAEVIKRYLHSGDFNGLYVDASKASLSASVPLVRDGLLEVVAEQDWMNPHIRPWPTRRSTESQVQSIEALTEDAFGLCLYPTKKALASIRIPRRYAGQPFSQAMAKGRATLELAYFRFDVLEQYSNDPRYFI